MGEMPLNRSRGRFHHPAFLDSGTMLPTVAICNCRERFSLCAVPSSQCQAKYTLQVTLVLSGKTELSV